MTNQFIDKKKMSPIESETVVEKVIHQITLAISSKRFKMGQRLPSEFELMDELHVSRNSLREAMKILSAMGIVNIKRGDGTYVCSQVNPSIFDSIIYSMILETSTDQQVVELRQILDEAVLKLAMKKCTDQQIAKLQNFKDQMRYYFNNGEISRAAKLDYQFHIYLTECCDNGFLARIVKGVYQIFEQSIEKNIRTEEQFAKADEYHQEMIDCLKNKDVSQIEEVIGNTLLSWKKNVKTHN